MKFSEIVEQACALIQRKGRVSYRALQREFELDKEDLEDLKEELLFAYPQVTDEDGRGLIWNGEAETTSTPQPPPPPSQPPASYTPPHLAERILAEQAWTRGRRSIQG